MGQVAMGPQRRKGWTHTLACGIMRAMQRDAFLPE